MTTTLRFVLYAPVEGIYLGSTMGFGFWSKLDPAGQDSAVTFENEEAACKFARTRCRSVVGAKPVKVEVDEAAPEYASIDQCEKAGLPRWNVMKPETSAPNDLPKD